MKNVKSINIIQVNYERFKQLTFFSAFLYKLYARWLAQLFQQETLASPEFWDPIHECSPKHLRSF